MPYHQVTLKHLDAEEGQEDTEIVHAKYVLGADGAHSWVRRTLDFTMDGEQTGIIHQKISNLQTLNQMYFFPIFFADYVWGVVDMIPKTDFPDIRNKCAIHSRTGSCMIIPREGDIVRLYLQLSDDDAKEVLNAKGRIDRTRWSPQRLMEIAKRSFRPYEIDFPEEVEWWTLYISKFTYPSSRVSIQRLTRR